jgi:hypothetical protein
MNINIKKCYSDKASRKRVVLPAWILGDGLTTRRKKILLHVTLKKRSMRVIQKKYEKNTEVSKI